MKQTGFPARRLSLAFATAMVVAASAHAGQQTCMPERLSSLGGQAFDVDRAGDTAYVAMNAGGLAIVDISDDANPQITNTVILDDRARAVVVRDDIAYVITNELFPVQKGALRLVDISDPQNPVTLDSIANFTFAQDIVVRDDVAYVADDGGGVHIIDVANPANISSLSTVETPGSADRIALRGDNLFVAARTAGLCVVDVTDPKNPGVIATRATMGNADDIAISGDVAYLVTGHEGGYRGFQVADITNPVSPVIIATRDTTSTSTRISIRDNFVFVGVEDAGLQIFDVSNPDDPVSRTTFDTPGSPRSLAFKTGGSRDVAILADTEGGIHTLDLANIESPVILGTANAPDHAWRLIVRNDLAYVANDVDSVDIVDLSNRSQPAVIGSIENLNSPGALAIRGDMLLIAQRDPGLVVVDVADPAAPVVVGSADTIAHATGIALHDDVAFVSTTDRDVQIFNISDPANPVALGLGGVPGGSADVVVKNNVAFVTQYEFFIAIDMTDPENPVLLDSIRLTSTEFIGGLGKIVIQDDIAYVTSGARQLFLLDVSNPADIQLLSTTDTTNHGGGIDVVGSRAFISGSLRTDDFGGMQIYDINDPFSPTLVGYWNTPNASPAVAVSGGVAYIADGTAGIHIVNVASCFNPADINYDGAVGAADLANLLGAWGIAQDSVADFNHDGQVNAIDLATLLDQWGN